MTTIAIPDTRLILPRVEFPAWVKRRTSDFTGAMQRPFKSAFHTPDAAPAFAPTDLTGLKLWFKPRSLALNDGDPISTNTDYSGNGWDATATLTTRPTFKTNIVNGLAIARYDASNDLMTVASGALGITNGIGTCTIVSVFSTTTVAATARGLFELATGGGSGRVALEMNRTAAKMGMRGRRLDGDGATQQDGATSRSTGTFYIAAGQVSWTASTVKLYVNGGTADINTSWTSSGSTSATDSTNIKLGSNNSGGDLWSGDIGDQLFYVPALSLSDLNLLGAYLGTTYGLTWTTAT